MAVSPPPAPSSIDLSGLPPRVVEAAARVLALCREELRSEPRPEAPEEVELRVREATNEFARDVMGAVIENRDDGASRIERDGQSWFRVAVTPKTIMTSLGPVTYRRARYRSGASGAKSTSPRRGWGGRSVTNAEPRLPLRARPATPEPSSFTSAHSTIPTLTCPACTGTTVGGSPGSMSPTIYRAITAWRTSAKSPTATARQLKACQLGRNAE